MNDRRIRQLEAHDAAGYETEFVNWSDYDDEYGNNVAHGDLSMQRMVEGGVRDGRWPTIRPDQEPPLPAERYDTDPVALPIGNIHPGGPLPNRPVMRGGAAGAVGGRAVPGHVGGMGRGRMAGYDKDPFQSKAQQRFMFAAEARGDIAKGTAERWAHHTKNIKNLPERKGK